jgi:hypothetical protein
VKINRVALIYTALFAWSGLVLNATAWQPGTYPAAPSRMATTGFSVDNQNRNDVVAFWHAVYGASDGYEKRINWTGNYTGSNGTISTEFVGDVQRRLNYFRAMSGLNASTRVSADSTVVIEQQDIFKPSPSTLKSSASQNAALMLVRNYDSGSGYNPALTHYPASSLIGWTAQAWNATSKGNFAFGLYGPDAISEYMIEKFASSTVTSSWNSLVGHRRWNLFPRATVFATGDQPGKSAILPPTNVFYVLQKPDELLTELSSGFVAYPAPGYFPVTVNSPYWSLSREGADFSSAVVKMSDPAGNPVPIVSIKRSDEYGDPAIIWGVNAAVSVQSIYSDTTFNVNVSGIAGKGIPESYSYSVTLINPDRILTNPSPIGVSSLPANGSAAYTFAAPSGAEGLQLLASRRSSKVWTEDAEKASSAKVIDGTGGNYPLIVKPSSFSYFGNVSGNYAFHLTFPVAYDLVKRGVPEQIFEIDRDIIAKTNAKLTFEYRRGFMTLNSTLVVESSSDGGVSWKILGEPIKGISDTTYSASSVLTSRSLSKSSKPIHIRFRYFTNGGTIYTHEAAPSFPTGIFLDDISVKNCDWLEPIKTKTYTATARQFAFNSKFVGTSLVIGNQWHLRLRTKLGGKWFPAGPAKIVTVSK